MDKVQKPLILKHNYFLEFLQMENNTLNEMNAADAQPAGDIAMDNLYPALLECFAVILCG
jgi:hypothetical protein